MSGTRVRSSGMVRRAALVWAAGVAVWPVAARASIYVGPEGVGYWSVASNWNPAGVPGAGEAVSFFDYSSVSRTLMYDYAGPAVRLTLLSVDQMGTGTHTFEMSAGFTLTADRTSIGSNGSGVFNQSGGIVQTSDLLLGYQPGTRATYTLGGGELRPLPSNFTSTPGSQSIGFGGTGVFEHTGGSNRTGTLLVGYQDGSGTYRMSGSARLEVTQYEDVGGGFSGTNTTGLFEQSGGVHVTAGLVIGRAKSATYRLSGDGSLAVSQYELIYPNGRFEQSGGTHTVNAALSVGGAGAAYTMSAGTLSTKGLSVGGASATFDLSGGTATVTGTVNVTPGGALNMSGGTLTATGGLTNAGAVNVTGATLSGVLVNGGTVRASAGAALTVTGGLSGSNAAATALSRLVVETGATVVTSFVRQGSLELNNVEVNPPVPAPVVSIRRKADGGGTSVVGALAVGTDSQGRPAGRVDLADNALVVDYGGASPIADVRSLIGAAWAGGAWTGNGIGSSVAAGATGRGLGYAEASAVVGAGGGTFEGQSVDGTAVVVKYTVMGDATLNGGVNFDDLLALAKHYNATDAVWSDGDFNYDAVVNFNDLLVLAKNYNGTLAGPVPGAPAGFDGDVAAAFAQAAVPEPGGFLGLVAAGVCIAGRRRRETRGCAGRLGTPAGGRVPD